MTAGDGREHLDRISVVDDVIALDELPIDGVEPDLAEIDPEFGENLDDGQPISRLALNVVAPQSGDAALGLSVELYPDAHDAHCMLQSRLPGPPRSGRTASRSWRVSFLDDILGQPDALRATAAALAADTPLLDRLRALPGTHRSAILTGMGSSHAALYPAHLALLEMGMPNAWADTGELLHYSASGIGSGSLLVIASQSGESVEIVRLIERLPRDVTIVGVTNHADSTLARRADVPIVLRAGSEGVVATRTYVATVAALHLAVTAIGGGSVQVAREEIESAATALATVAARHEQYGDALGRALGAPPRDLFLVGRGPSFASAMAGSLVVKEASLTGCEPLSGGHFRHGPIEMVSAQTSALLFSPAGRTHGLMRRLAADIHRYGGRVALVGPADAIGPGAHLPIVDTGTVPESVAPLVEIVAAEIYTIACARGRGREPAVFDRLGKVTREE
ncbi:MAG: SIS domain-containing protein [Chloroflexi bacterium]|nr:SIS domain-containing protein [Chloroflexota bacterium]